MAQLKKLVSNAFLQTYLRKAKACCEPCLSLTVMDQDGKILGTTLAKKNPELLDSQDLVKAAILLAGQEVGNLVLELPSGWTDARRQSLLDKADFLVTSLQNMIESEAARRAIAAETLEMYRSHAQLNRAVLSLNRSLVIEEIGASLLLEFQGKSHECMADWGGIFWPYGQSNPWIATFGQPDQDPVFEHISQSALFWDIASRMQGEIINELTSDPRWSEAFATPCALLMVPLEGGNKAVGMLVLGVGSSRQEFHAVDLHRASTLAVVAAAALRNAMLYQETLSIKIYHESILKSLSNGVITFDLEGMLVKANEAARRILGMSEEQLLGQAAQTVFRDANHWIGDRVDRLLKNDKVESIMDREIQSAAGGVATVNLSTAPLIGPDGQLIGGLLVLEDISREKRIKGTMARYMPSQVLDNFLEMNDVSILGGKEQEVTILFSDLRSFTSLSENLTALETIAMLNDYLGRMVDVIFSNNGTLDKFLGDAIMAVFGTPMPTENDVENAVQSARDMMVRLREFNELRVKEGKQVLRMGIGMNTGLVVSGHIGSAKRMDYTVIGDEVNLTARLETATKFYGTPILLSENTFTRLKNPWRCREIDRVRVKGKQRPVRIYEILDYVNEKDFPDIDQALACFNQGMAAYHNRQWQQASEAFAQAIRIKSTDKPSLIYLQRCLGWVEKDPGPDWDGVTTLE